MSRVINTVAVDVVKDDGGFYATPMNRIVPCTLTTLGPQFLSNIVQVPVAGAGNCSSGTWKPGDHVPDNTPNSTSTMAMDGPEGRVWIEMDSYNNDFLTGCNGCCIS